MGIIGTNSYQSNCLIVDEHSTPSYNYDNSFIDMTQSTDIESELAGKLSSSFSHGAIKSEAVTIESDSYSELYLAVSNMRIDRYFSGFKTSSMMNDAKELLQHQDYIGFFQSCGTNYVRSIRRAQEITAIFKFSSPSRDLAQEFAAEIKTQGGAPAIDESIFDQEKFSTVKQNLEVKILAYGLGLNTKGESVIVSTSVKNYNKVMEFAFRSFTQSTDSSNVGMVYALEFVPWVDNPSFQHASKIFDEDIELPLSRSLIPRAIADDGVLSFVNNRLIRSQFSCKHLYFSIDKFGYCCDAAELFHQERGLYETEELDIESSSRICKPNRKLEKSVIKNTMSNNGEFVARLELTVQKKINQLFTLEKCVASVNSMVEKYDSYILKSQGSTKYDSSVEGKFTVNQLKMSLDPIGDLSLITHMGNELDEFINMYYQPCIAALFGTSVGSSPDVEAKYFMAYGWLTHEACSKLSCLADNMRWNRNGSGCIGSLITGRKAPTYDVNDIACEKNDEGKPSDGSELCKYNTTDLQLYQTKLNTCWDDPNPTSRVPYYILEHFCMPEIIGEKIEEDIIHPCLFPCHGISLALSDANMITILSENSSTKAIVQCFDTSEATNMDNFLSGSNINADLSSWDVSSVTSMWEMFKTASVFNGDISRWDVSVVTNMYKMFNEANAFNSGISGWDVSSVTTMQAMFNQASIFNSDISSWDVSSVTRMDSMFVQASIFDNDISGWDVSSVNTMQSMFYGAHSFNKYISSWDVSSVIIMNRMFRFAYMFDSDISGWDVSSVTSLSHMFIQAYRFNTDISSWDVAAVDTMYAMFRDAAEFRQEMCEWNLEDVTVGEMFTNSKCTIAFCVDCPSS